MKYYLAALVLTAGGAIVGYVLGRWQERRYRRSNRPMPRNAGRWTDWK